MDQVTNNRVSEKPLTNKESSEESCWKQDVFLNDSDILNDTAFIRALEISGLESPYLTANLDFSGQCDHLCPECHSKALWQSVDSDKLKIEKLIENLDDLFRNRSLIEGICFLGTDSRQREKAVRAIIQYANWAGLVTIVFTGHDLHNAMGLGQPSFFVCGTYIGNEWHSNKRFYKRQGESYIEISVNDYFRRNI